MLNRTYPAIRRAALMALDQMDGGGLKPEVVAPLLAAPDPALRETATWIAGRHAEWGGRLAGRSASGSRPSVFRPDQRSALEHLLARLASAAPIQELLAGSRGRYTAPQRHAVDRAAGHGPVGREADAESVADEPDAQS